MFKDFDKSDVFEAEIQEKIDEILRICNRERIPMFFCAAVKNSAEGTEYKKEMFATASNNISLKQDFIPHFLNVTNGFLTVPPMDVVEIEFE